MEDGETGFGKRLSELFQSPEYKKLCDRTHKNKSIRDYLEARRVHRYAESDLQETKDRLNRLIEWEKESRNKMELAFSKLDEEEKQRQLSFDESDEEDDE